MEGLPKVDPRLGDQQEKQKISRFAPGFSIPESFQKPLAFDTPRNRKAPWWGFLAFLAEMEGFEPPVQLPTHRISSAAHSTTLAHLQSKGKQAGLFNHQHGSKNQVPKSHFSQNTKACVWPYSMRIAKFVVYY